MEIKKVAITIRDLCEGYVNESEHAHSRVFKALYYLS